jgi:type II restriction/modification system DNA methylase subunit YeeA
MRRNCLSKRRFLATVSHAKHRLFVWVNSVFLPDGGVFAFARDDDYFFGVVHSRFHEAWSLKQGTHLEDRPRYTPKTCFETFPFPFTNDLSMPAPAPKKTRTAYASGWEDVIERRFLTIREEPPPYIVGGAGRKLSPAEHRAAIAAVAKELNELRENWLNPPEWTVERILEFPASVNGPWARYVVEPNEKGLGRARYPRLEPRDAECAAKLKKRTLTNLYNKPPAWLDLAHKKLDAAVAAAYGWPADLSDDQILERLLALNLERAAKEAQAAKSTKRKIQRDKSEKEMI